MDLTSEQLHRYSRQIILRDVGVAGQKKLLESTVLVIGAGGLGSASAFYLAAAGVGEIILADGDQVELSNLGRQIIHTTQSVGHAKTESARATLTALNPGIRITTVEQWLDEENIADWVAKANLVIDGSDNVETRYQVNAACHRLGKTLIYGAVIGFEGQLSTFRSGNNPTSPCYQCVFPVRPSMGAIPNCATAGVFGAMAGIVGSLQASEGLKELLDLGHSLAGTLLLVDMDEVRFHRIALSKEPNCPVCGQ